MWTKVSNVEVNADSIGKFRSCYDRNANLRSGSNECKALASRAQRGSHTSLILLFTPPRYYY